MAKFQFHFDVGPVCLKFALFDERPRFCFDVGWSNKHDCGVFYLGADFMSGVARLGFGRHELHIRGAMDALGLGVTSDGMHGLFTVRYQGAQNAYILADLDGKLFSEIDPIVLDVITYDKLPLIITAMDFDEIDGEFLADADGVYCVTSDGYYLTLSDGGYVSWAYLHNHQYNFKTLSGVTWDELQKSV